MREENIVQVDVEEIMREIRRDIQMKEELSHLPEFTDIPLRDGSGQQRREERQLSPAAAGGVNWTELEESLAYINVYYDIPYYWNFSGGRLKVFLKRVVRKLNKCLIAPILGKQNGMNTHFVRCVNNLYTAVRDLLSRLSNQERDSQEWRRTLLSEVESRQNELKDAFQNALREQQTRQEEALRSLLRSAEEVNQELRAELERQNSEIERQNTELEQRDAQIQSLREECRSLLEERNSARETELAQLRDEVFAQFNAQRQEEKDGINQLRAEREEDIRTVRAEQNGNRNMLTARADTLDARVNDLSAKFALLDRQSDDFSAAVAKMICSTKKEGRIALTERQECAAAAESADSESVYQVLDYFKFQNEFRGTRSTIMERQQMYLPYFQAGKAPVLDLGCGRGEFLKLMKKNGIEAYGVDLYPEYVVEGQLNGVDIREGDALVFLRETEERFGGIFAGQLIEHISFQELEMLCKTAYEKLLPGAYLVMETPNPMCLSTFALSFYIDPTHNRPVHPLTLGYLLQEIGFSEVQTIFTDCSRQAPLPQIQSSAIENLEQVNEGINRVSELLYGSLDYAVVARK